MANMQCVTVTVPDDLLREIDRMESNRSRFVLHALRREIEHRRRERLRRSLDHPHAEAEKMTEAGFDEWADGLPEDDPADLVNLAGGKPVRWVVGEGWQESAQ